MHTRVAKGIWRKSGDRPEGVDWHERVIDVCEGGWTYVAGATGYAPSKFRSVFEIRAGVLESHIINDVCVPHIILSFNCSCRADDRGRMIDDDPFLIVVAAADLLTDKIVGSAIPFADELEHYKLSWHLSNGSTLVISRPFHDDHDWEHNLEFTLTGFSTSLVSWCHEIARDLLEKWQISNLGSSEVPQFNLNQISEMFYVYSDLCCAEFVSWFA